MKLDIVLNEELTIKVDSIFDQKETPREDASGDGEAVELEDVELEDDDDEDFDVESLEDDEDFDFDTIMEGDWGEFNDDEDDEDEDGDAPTEYIGGGDEDDDVYVPDGNDNGDDDDDEDEKQPEQEQDNSKLPELNDKDLEKLETALNKQQDFIRGDIEKKDINAKRSKEIDAIEESNVEMESVAKDLGYNARGVNVIVVKKVTQSLIDTDPFGIFHKSFNSRKITNNDANIEKGIVLGNMLGRRLQIRNEERNTVYSRLRNGKIDNRLINSLGYGAEQVFSQVVVNKFNPVLLHISVDASGSMDGNKWDNTLTSVVAICKAASMVSNLDVVVDFRACTQTMTDTLPLVLVGYDSRVDKFEKVRRVFNRISLNNSTPEGLCFEAISKLMKEDKAKDQFFINFSDGEPGFSNKSISYAGGTAVEHTKKQVNKMRDKGFKILSYFIAGGYSYSTSSRAFAAMYGKDAKTVNVTELLPLANSLNSLFLEQ